MENLLQHTGKHIYEMPTHLQIMLPRGRVRIEFLVGWRRAAQISDNSTQSSTVVPVGLWKMK